MKILDNAIVTMCGECDMVKYDTFTQTNICCHSKMNHKTETVCNCDISKDCPLQDCEVIDWLTFKPKLTSVLNIEFPNEIYTGDTEIVQNPYFVASEVFGFLDKEISIENLMEAINCYG